jgi:hypothetical protein
MVVGIGLRFLGRESHKSLEQRIPHLKSSSKRAVGDLQQQWYNVKNSKLNYQRRKNSKSLKTKWCEMSTAPGKLLHGCILALDGFLSARVKPNIEDDAHYHSIHKMIHCLNVQATIDYLLCFRYVCVAAPGRTNDGRAFERCKELVDFIRDLANDCCIASDNAHPLSKKILISFKANQIAGNTRSPPTSTCHSFEPESKWPLEE